MPRVSDADRTRGLLEAREHHAAAWREQERWEAHLAAAIATLRGVLDSHPGDEAAQVSLGGVLSDRGRHAEARRLLEPLLKRGSTDRTLYWNYAVALMNLGASERREAKRWFDRAAELQASPDTIEAYIDFHGH